jgi:polar amino acid transport system substrate-binding protein
MLARILNSTIRINNIVTGIKHYTSSARIVHAEKVNVNDVVRSCVEMYSDQIRKSTDNFQLLLDEEAPLVAGSRQALEEVISNLISNALQALADRTKRVSVFTRLDQNDDSVMLEVRDEGAGMTPEVIKKATNPFFTTRENSGGIGLGLSIVHSIIKNHGGSLDFESRPGQGTVTTVRLPAMRE